MAGTMAPMRVHIATDHAGFELKEYLVPRLAEAGYDVVDHGAAEYDALDDYPPMCIECGKAVVADPRKPGNRPRRIGERRADRGEQSARRAGDSGLERIDGRVGPRAQRRQRRLHRRAAARARPSLRARPNLPGHALQRRRPAPASHRPARRIRGGTRLSLPGRYTMSPRLTTGRQHHRVEGRSLLDFRGKAGDSATELTI